MTLAQKLLTWAGVIGGLGSTAALLQGPADHLWHEAQDILTAMDTVRMIQGTQSEIQVQNLIILEDQLAIEKTQDSILQILDLLNQGKLPHDAIHLRSESGHHYSTTLKDKLNR